MTMFLISFISFFILFVDGSWNPQFYCQYPDVRCDTIPPAPLPRRGHSAIVYTTWSSEDIDNLCPGYYCGPYCDSTDASCFISNRNPTDGTDGGRGDLPPPSGKITGLDPSSPDCPDNCCNVTNENCFRTLDNTGYPVEKAEEIMLVFGGKTYRNIRGGANKLLYEACEKINFNDPTLDPITFSCGEQLLNDIWRYHIRRKKWSYVKPDYNRELYTDFMQPSARFGHASVYIETSVVDKHTNQVVVRKYMYMYGGFSYECVDACGDLWRYEIPWAAQRYYPKPKQTGIWWNRGNHWTLLSNNTNVGPGKRYFHSMQADYQMNAIYLFGGIMCSNSTCKHMNDVWKYYIELDKWELVNTQGISKIYRNVSLWDGTTVFKQISPEDQKETDIVEYANSSTSLNTTSLLPYPRAQMATTLLGNPPVNIIIYGGTTSVDGKRKVLDDMWSFSTYSSTWRQIFPNSELPSKREGASLVTVKMNQFSLLFGGHFSSALYNGLWQYNIDTNMWFKLKYTEDNDIPPGTAYGTLVIFSDVIFITHPQQKGIILYGGMNWLNETDTEALTSSYNPSVYIYYFETCPDNCNNRGICRYGACKCDSRHYGNKCQYKRCPNTLCYYDIDTIDPSECVVCNGHGVCQDGVCVCDKGYVGEDCLQIDCINNCSNTANDTYGYCVHAYPISQCVCNESLRRGGDYCEKIFCLNNCTGNGKCLENGTCICDQLYSGEDCSIFVYPVNSGMCIRVKALTVLVLLAFAFMW